MKTDDYEGTLHKAMRVALVVLSKHMRKRRARTFKELVVVLAMLKEMEELDDSGDDQPCVKRTRHVFARADYLQSPWAIMLRALELCNHNSSQAKAFGRRFRVPHPFFLAIVGVEKAQGWPPSPAADIYREAMHLGGVEGVFLGVGFTVSLDFETA